MFQILFKRGYGILKLLIPLQDIPNHVSVKNGERWSELCNL